MRGSKTARTIATGVWWRIGVAGVARWSNGHCFTLERSTTVSTKAGAERFEVFDDQAERTMPLALFAADRQLPNFAAGFGVRIRLKEMELHRPRQWGACWLACHLYEQLGLHDFWAECLPDSREGTCWQHILQTLVCYGLIDPGSEWRLHRQWFEQSAMGDLLDGEFSLVEQNALYRCLDKVLKHKEELFRHLRQRWQDLFGARLTARPIH